MALNIKTPADCLRLLKRHKHVIILPWLITSALAVIIAFNMPKTFRSTATMLFESPLPTKLFEATVSQYADEQIQSIYQRVMKTDSVLSIIEANGLFADEKNGLPKHELAELFKKNTDVKLTATSLTPKSSSGMAEIAFDISFSDKEPSKAAEIAGQLARLFIEKNDMARTQRAGKATVFLMEESEKLNHDLQDIDNRIATYKEQNNFSLPEQAQANLTTIDRNENELRDTDNQIRATKERIAFLAAELSRTQADLPSTVDGEKIPQNKDEALSLLRAKYAQLSSVYSQSHPTLMRLKREIKALDPGFGGQPAGEDLYQQLETAKTDLKSLEELYSSNHPDIVKRKTQIESLERQLNTRPPLSNGSKAANTRITNPSYLNVEAQYKGSQSELEVLLQKRDYLKSKLEKMQQVLMVAPQVEKGYNDLLRERENIVKKYNQLKEKLLDAKLFQTQEEQQKGQTLTIIEEPIVPTHAEKASRRKVAIGGFFAGIILGLGFALLAEMLDPRLRGYQALAEATGLMPIIVIPYIESASEMEHKLAGEQRQKQIILWTVLLVIVLAIAAVFLLFSPFEKS